MVMENIITYATSFISTHIAGELKFKVYVCRALCSKCTLLHITLELPTYLVRSLTSCCLEISLQQGYFVRFSRHRFCLNTENRAKTYNTRIGKVLFNTLL